MMKDVINRAKELADAGNDFNTIFIRVVGKLEVDAKLNMGDTCLTSEVVELFDLLFDIKIGKYKKGIPGSGNFQGSRW